MRLGIKNLLQNKTKNFFFCFWLVWSLVGYLFPHQGLNPCPLQWKWNPKHCTAGKEQGYEFVVTKVIYELVLFGGIRKSYF